MFNKIILFDGECNFCDASVQFIIKRDSKKTFQFASLQSEFGQKIREKFAVPESLDSMLLIDNEKLYTKSTAALRICKNLKGGWKLVYLFILIPAPIRNLVYRFVAKNRYKWFGKKNQCMIPSPELKNRFIS